MIDFELVAAPTTEPLTLAEAHAWLMIESGLTSDDTLITSLISDARRHVEEYTGRYLIDQTWDIHYDLEDIDDPLWLPVAPVSSITSITSYSSSDSSSTVATTVYQLLGGGGLKPRITLKQGQTWPSDQRSYRALTVRAVLGYGSTSSDVPEPLVRATSLWLEHLYTRSRGEAIEEQFRAGAPDVISSLLGAWRKMGV